MTTQAKSKDQNHSAPKTYNAIKRETVRKAQIISKEQHGFCVDGTGTMDGNPDRYEMVFKPLNCTTEEFAEWFRYSKQSNKLCFCENTLIDLDGSSTLDVGTVIGVSFSEFLTGWIDCQR